MRTRRFFIYACCALFMAGPVLAADSARFFLSMQDMPLMRGLRELPDQALTFDKPEGRFIEAVAAVESGTSQQVKAYYESALPELGWIKIAEGQFLRQGEQLRLTVESFEKGLFLRIVISPGRGDPGLRP